MIAYCDKSGIIHFGRKIPEGSLPIATGPGRKLKRIVLGIANTMTDGNETPYLQNLRMADLLGLDALEQLGLYRLAIEHKLAGKPGWPAVRLPSPPQNRSATSNRRAKA